MRAPVEEVGRVDQEQTEKIGMWALGSHERFWIRAETRFLEMTLAAE